MNFGSLFSGVEGIGLGLEWAGMSCAWQVEIDDYCLEVLNRNSPDVPKYGDVKDVGRHNLEPVDLIAGGFPCQPHSVAGKRRGAADDRNLWPEFSRIIAELKPRYVLAENVPGIITTYLDTVLSDLESQGYTCATFNIPACAFDAPHRRERIFIVAYSDRTRKLQQGGGKRTQRRRIGNESKDVANTEDTNGGRADGENNTWWRHQEIRGRRESGSRLSYWTVEPGVGRSPYGFPVWLERHIGRGMSYEESARATEILRKLWNKDVAETLWQTIGGFDRIQKSEILFSIMRQYQKDIDQAWVLLESKKALERFVRGLWEHEKITGSPHRPKDTKQSRREHSDSMQILSRLLAFNGETNWQISSWEDGIPRIATNVPSRVDRLRALGNAVVPQVAEWIGRRIIEFDEQTTALRHPS